MQHAVSVKTSLSAFDVTAAVVTFMVLIKCLEAKTCPFFAIYDISTTLVTH